MVWGSHLPPTPHFASDSSGGARASWVCTRRDSAPHAGTSRTGTSSKNTWGAPCLFLLGANLEAGCPRTPGPSRAPRLPASSGCTTCQGGTSIGRRPLEARRPGAQWPSAVPRSAWSVRGCAHAPAMSRLEVLTLCPTESCKSCPLCPLCFILFLFVMTVFI